LVFDLNQLHFFRFNTFSFEHYNIGHRKNDCYNNIFDSFFLTGCYWNTFHFLFEKFKERKYRYKTFKKFIYFLLNLKNIYVLLENAVIIYINDSYQFTYISFIKFPIIFKFDSKFNREFRTFLSEITKTFQIIKEKCSSISFSQNDNSKITSEYDSNSGS
jgi:hypothetical protein